MVSDGSDPDENEDGKVLSPDELDITEDESVKKLDEGRYVISPDESSPVPVDQGAPEQKTGVETPTNKSQSITREEAHDWLYTDLTNSESQYGFDITAKFEQGIDQQTLHSNDIVTTFENLLVWYAQRAGGDTPVEEVIGILLLESNVPISFPPKTVQEFVTQYDLNRSDTVGDLLDSVQNDDVQFPP